MYPLVAKNLDAEMLAIRPSSLEPQEDPFPEYSRHSEIRKFQVQKQKIQYLPSHRPVVFL